jgi:hypothetical protein
MKRKVDKEEITVYRDTNPTNENTKWLPQAPAAGVAFPIGEMVSGGGPLVQVQPSALDIAGGGESYETPISSAKAQIWRLAPFTLIWLVLSGGLVLYLSWSGIEFLLLWGLLSAISYFMLDRNGHQHTRNGLERHRVDKAANIQELGMEQDHERKMHALNLYGKIAIHQYLGEKHDRTD